jgi:hypothetical protein
MLNDLNKLLKDYHHFDDGLILSFGFFYPEGEELAAHAFFYARNHTSLNDRWDTVRIILKNVVEFCSIWRGNQANSICSGVHIIDFGDIWCLDIDGVYLHRENPVSIEDVRESSSCYATGSEVEFQIFEGKLALNDFVPKRSDR